jgi:hypothetical protein
LSIRKKTMTKKLQNISSQELLEELRERIIAGTIEVK